MIRCRLSPARTPRDGGFTLIEALVSLVIVALILSMAPPVLRFAQRALGVANAVDHASSDAAELAFVERRLAATVPVFERSPDGLLALAFKGDARSVTFVAPMLTNSNASGLFLFTLHPLDGADAKVPIALTWQAFRSIPDTRDPPPGPESRVVLANGQSFALRYFGAPASGQDPDWVSTWSRTDALPALIEVSFTTGQNDTTPRTRRVELQLRSRQ